MVEKNCEGFFLLIFLQMFVQKFGVIFLEIFWGKWIPRGIECSGEMMWGKWISGQVDIEESEFWAIESGSFLAAIFSLIYNTEWIIVLSPGTNHLRFYIHKRIT